MMYPGTIHKWFTTHRIDPAIGWEALELTAPRWSEDDLMPLIEDEAELLTSMVDWCVGMIDIAADEPRGIHGLIEHVGPVILSLSPHLESHHRTGILDASDKVQGMWVYSFFQTLLFPLDG